MVSTTITNVLMLFAVAGCATGPPPCDSVCRQAVALESARLEFQQRRIERASELAEQEQEARRALAESSSRLAASRAELERVESTTLRELNEARAQIGLPAISHWSSEPGGLTPDGALLLFGGKDHKTFLGCLCNPMEPDSVLNTTGEFGPSGFKYESIWNHFSEYGSTFGDFSPCSTFAKSPPVVVSKSGQFFGYLSIDRFRDKVVTDAAIVDWLKSVCVRD